MHSDQPSSPRAFPWEAGSLAKSNFPNTQWMGSQITIWQNESDELTFRELIFDEFSRGTCAQKHTQRIIALPHHQKEKKKKFRESQESILTGRLMRWIGSHLTSRDHLLCTGSLTYTISGHRSRVHSWESSVLCVGKFILGV